MAFKLLPVIPALLLSWSAASQSMMHPCKAAADSICLQEVEITGSVPLNNRQIESFYKLNTLSTIDNVIERLDGISMIRRGSYAMEPDLNGFSGGQLSITIDGMKMFGACTDRMDPITSYVEPSNLKSITVMQGSGGCHNGSCTGGSIDMALMEPGGDEDKPFNAALSLGYETVSNGKTAILSTGYSKNKWQFALNGSYRKHDSYKDGSGDIVPFTQYEKMNVNSVLKFLPDKYQNFRLDFLFDLAQNVGYAALPMDVLKARAFLAALEYRNTKKADLTARIYYNNVLHIMDDSKRDSAFYLTNETTGQIQKVYMRMDMPGTSATLGAYVQAVIKLHSKNKLTLRVDNYTNHSLAEMTMYMHYPEQPPESPMYLQTWPDVLRTVTGLYIQDSWRVSKKVRLNLGGRLDYNLSIPQSDLAKEQFSVFQVNVKDHYQVLTKNLTLDGQYLISDPWSISFETGYSERIPTISEQFGFYLYNAYDGYDYIGNPDIKTEKSIFGRFSVQYTHKRIRINLSQSIYRLHDYIMGLTDTTIPPMNFYTNGTRVYSNLPGATVYSANLQLQAIPVKHLSVYLLSKFTWGELNSGEPLPLIPPLTNVLAVNYQHNRWYCTLENETALAQNRINNDYGETRSPAYTVFNIKGGYHFMFMKPVMLDCSLAVTNLLNANYYEHLDWGQINRPGRSVNILVRFSF